MKFRAGIRQHELPDGRVSAWVRLREAEGVPQSRFSSSRTLAEIAAEQQIRAVGDIAQLALEDPDQVPLEEFTAFLRTARRSG